MSGTKTPAEQVSLKDTVSFAVRLFCVRMIGKKAFCRQHGCLLACLAVRECIFPSRDGRTDGGRQARKKDEYARFLCVSVYVGCRVGELGRPPAGDCASQSVTHPPSGSRRGVRTKSMLRDSNGTEGSNLRENWRRPSNSTRSVCLSVSPSVAAGSSSRRTGARTLESPHGRLRGGLFLLLLLFVEEPTRRCNSSSSSLSASSVGS